MPNFCPTQMTFLGSLHDSLSVAIGTLLRKNRAHHKPVAGQGESHSVSSVGFDKTLPTTRSTPAKVLEIKGKSQGNDSVEAKEALSQRNVTSRASCTE